MHTANAIKVGVWIVIAVAILIFGTRYFQGLALGGSRTVIAEFERVDGLIAGNTVQMRGVRVGNVSGITIHSDRALVEVRLNINKSVTIREGAEARLSGIAALGDMRIEIEPGPADNPIVPNGGRIDAANPVDLVADLTEAAGGYMKTIESILEETEQSMSSLNESFSDKGDIQVTLEALKGVSETFDALLMAEAVHLSNTIRNFESVTANLDSLTSTTGDSTVIASLQRSLDQLDLTLQQTQSLTSSLDSILVKVNRGDGTLGKLANDESLYNSMDSVAINLSRLLESVRQNPKRYLRELKISMF